MVTKGGEVFFFKVLRNEGRSKKAKKAAILFGGKIF